MPKTATKADKPEQSKEVMSIQDRIKDRLAKVNDATAAPASSKISVKGSMFTLPDGKSSKGPLNCIILDYINQNTYYKDQWVEGQFSEPDCYAIGHIIDDLKPSDNAKDKQFDNCKECPHNQFGSSGAGKACQNGVLLAIIPEDFTPESEVNTIRISPTGLKDWGKFVRELSERGMDPIQVVTSLSFKEGLSYPSLKFKALGGNEKLEDTNPFITTADALLKANL